MNLSRAVPAGLLLAALLGSTAPLPGAAAQKAKISLAQARSIALHAVPGKIADEELEPEAGGSGLRYTFDITTPQGTREVGVDAQSGAILENSKE